MARIIIHDSAILVWLSAANTRAWAARPRKSWPCSQLAGHRVFAAIDRNGLYEMAIDGDSSRDVDATEFNAVVADHVRPKLARWARKHGYEHPAWYVLCGQFEAGKPC